MTKRGYLVVAIGVVAIAIAASAFLRRPASLPADGKTATSGTSTASSQTTQPGRTGGTTAVKPVSTQKSAISVIAPAESEKWVIGQYNIIRWSKEAKVPGSIYLVKAGDKTVVGWINSEIGPNQTSYSWDTRDVFLSRYNPAKKNLEVGDYIIKIKFDNKNFPEISSGRFSVIYPTEVQIPMYEVRIQDFAFNPSSLSVKKGGRIKFVNSDSVEHKLLLQSFSPIPIPAGQTYIFDTSVFQVGGVYDFYSEAYSTLKLRITVVQ